MARLLRRPSRLLAYRRSDGLAASRAGRFLHPLPLVHWSRWTGPSLALIHRLIRQPVGFLVAAAEGVAHFESLQAGGASAGLLPERAQRGTRDLVAALHLIHHQL